MLLNSLSVLFDFSKWESITSAFGIIILSGFLLGLAIESWNTWSLTRIFRGKKFNHKKLSAANIKFKGSFLKGSGEKTRHHADEFFELNKLQSYNSVVEAIPNSLVGIGILGTFLGLSIGVMGLKDQSSAEAIKEGVQSLLGSMSTAFVTSVLGMFFSILMTFLLRFLHSFQKSAHNQFCEDLDSKHYITDEELSEIERDRLRSMLQELFGIETNHQNTTPGELLIQNLQANQAASAKLEDFGAELADGLALSANTISAIEEQLGSRFSNLFQTHLGSHMESMTKSLESIDGKETSQADTFADNLESSLNKLIEQFQSGLNSGARDEMISMQENLAATSQSLITLPKILEETKTGFQSMTQQFQELGAELGQKLAQQIQAASEQASAAQAAGAEAAKESLDSVASVSSSLTQEMQRGMETYMRTNAASVEQLNELVGRIRGVLEDNVNSSESIGVAITSLTSASKSLNANTQDLQSGLSSMTRMNESMAQVSSTLSGVTSGLENAIRSQGEIVEGVFEQAKQAMADQLTAYGDVNDELSKIKDAFSESLQHYQAQVNDAVNSNLQAFATRLTDVAESLTSAYNALQETVGDMEGVLNRQGKDLR